MQDALKKAEDAGLDLVEVSPNASPPVCRIMDYGKYLFALRKKDVAAKKKQKHVQLKEVKLRPVTEEGDYQIKVKKVLGFLENGDKAKVSLRFKYREVAHRDRKIMHHDLGFQLLRRIADDLKEHSIVEVEPKQESKLQLIMVLAPKRK